MRLVWGSQGLGFRVYVSDMRLVLAQGGGPKQVQARLMAELKEEFGDLPRDEMRKVLRERMEDMTKRDAAKMVRNTRTNTLHDEARRRKDCKKH